MIFLSVFVGCVLISLFESPQKVSQSILSDKIHEALDRATKRIDPSRQASMSYHEFRKNQCLADDKVAKSIQSELLYDAGLNLRQKKFQKVPANLLSATFDLSITQVRKIGKDIRVFELKAGESKSTTFKKYIQSFEQIDHLDFEIVDYAIPSKERRYNGDPSTIKALVDFDLRGIRRGKRVHDSLTLKVGFSESNSQWLLSGVTIDKGQRTDSARQPSFSDSTAALGLDNIPIHLRREAIRRGGYSIAVNDYNNDHTQDLFIGTGGNAVLLKGEKSQDGTLKFSKTKSALEGSTFVKSSVFADFDNDGDEDAVLIRFVDRKRLNEQVVYYENINGTYTERNDVFSDQAWNSNYAMPAAVGDFNRDSYLDFYVGFPGKDDFTSLINSAGKREPHGLFYNNTKGGFNHSNKTAFGSRVNSNVFPHSAIAVDYDQDSDTDLLIIDDRNNLSPILRNDGKKFYQQADKIGLGNSGYGMSIASGDFNGDGLIDFAMTNVVTRSDVRFSSSCQRNWAIQNPLGSEERGLRLFQNLGGGRFVDVTQGSGLEWPGSATGGIVFFDYDNDGRDDLYVVNGLWSGNNPKLDLGTAWTHLRANHYYDNTLKYSHRNTHSELMTLLIDFQGDLYNNLHIPKQNPSFAGFQRNKLFKNLGEGRFVDVGYIENADRIEDGCAVVTADFDNNGKRDLVLRNADPGAANNLFSPVTALVNSNPEKNNFISYQLKGRVSNKDAIGAEVIVETPEGKQVKQLIANNGPQQDDRTLHFGIGTNSSAKVTVKWPNKATTIFKAVTPGFHTLREPVQGLASQ